MSCLNKLAGVCQCPKGRKCECFSSPARNTNVNTTMFTSSSKADWLWKWLIWIIIGVILVIILGALMYSAIKSNGKGTRRGNTLLEDSPSFYTSRSPPMYP